MTRALAGGANVANKSGDTGRKRNPTAEAVLEVALDLFSRKSYGEVGMQEIAQQANVTYSLLYYYFKNKEDLFHAAVAHAVERAHENYNKVSISDKSAAAIIDDWFDNNIKLSASLKRLVKIMLEFSEKREGAPSVAQDVERFYSFERTLLANSIRAGVKEGIFTCNCPEDTAAFVSTCIDGIFYGALLRGDTDIETAMQRLKQVLWRLLDYRPTGR
jgi:AcrR family transcriptional regulator